MQYIRIINFEKFQHYRDRKPPWIKLYRDLLSDDRLFELSEADRYQLIGLFLIASHHDNLIPNKSGWLRQQLGVNRPISLQNLVDTGWVELVEQDASGVLHVSGVLAELEHGAIPRARAERREEKRREETEEETEARPEHKATGTRDPAAELFAEKCLEFTRVPYEFKTQDFVHLAKLRVGYRIAGKETPEGWTEAITNYFGSALSKWTIADLANRYQVFRNSAVDRYGKPINHVNGGNGNGNGQPKDRQQLNFERAEALDARFDSKDRSTGERQPE